MKRVIAMACALAIASAGIALAAGTPRVVEMTNARDVFGGIYDNVHTNAVPNADGVVRTSTDGGNGPYCRITVTGLLPEENYRVYVDTDGWSEGDAGHEGPFNARGDFITDAGGDGQYRCSEAIGDGAAVFINYAPSGANTATVLVSDNLIASGPIPPDTGRPRKANLNNARDVFGGIYDNVYTNAVPDADGVVTTSVGVGPQCKITVTGLLPNENYRVYVDTDGWSEANAGHEGPFDARGDFLTDGGGNGQYRCTVSIGDGAAVYINYAPGGANTATVLVSDNLDHAP